MVNGGPNPCQTNKPSAFLPLPHLDYPTLSIGYLVYKIYTNRRTTENIFLLKIFSFLSNSDHEAETSGISCFKTKCTTLAKMTFIPLAEC